MQFHRFAKGIEMLLVSYAQNFEDIMLWRALRHVGIGFYIDVGAQSPDHDSVSKLFYEHGWRGMHIEPTDQYSTQLKTSRPDELVLQAAVADRPGELRFFDIADTGLSTSDEAIARDHEKNGFVVREVRVPGVTLAEVFAQAATAEVHWLKIDVEGAEAQVIRSWGDSAVRPWVLVIESTRPLSTVLSHQEWEQDVLDLGYVFAYFDGLNRFYVSVAHLELLEHFSLGPNVFDGFVLAPDGNFCLAAKAKFQEDAAQAVAIAKAEWAGDIARHEEEGRARVAEIESANAALLLAKERDMEALRAEYERKIEALLSEQSQVIEMLQSDVHEARVVTEAHRVEAIRQAHGAQDARAALMEFERSRTWRMTYPIRMTLTQVKRLRHPRRFARDALVAMMRPVLRSYRTGQAVNAAVKLVPPLHERLRMIAVRRGLMYGGGEAADLALGQVGTSFGRARAMASLGGRGREILERIESSRKGRR